MDVDNLSNENDNSSHEDQQEPTIKQEVPNTWQLPHEVDLISEDGSQDGTAGISGGRTSITTDAAPSRGTNANNAKENQPTKSRTDLLKLQEKLANKYRTDKPERPVQPTEPEPEEESSSDDEDKDAEFQKAKAKYNRKKKAQKLTLEDEIEFIRLESSFMARQRKAEADAEFDRSPSDTPEDADDDGGLFVSEDAPRYSELYSDNEDDEPKTPKTRKRNNSFDIERPSKKMGRAKKVLGHDYNDDDIEVILSNARRADAKSKAKNEPKSKSKSKSKPKPAPNPKAKSKKTKGQGTQITNVNSLFGQDVFEAAAQTANLPSQPTFAGTKRRDEALKQLIADVPEERHDLAKADLKYLHAAIKDFTGHTSVRPHPDGNWEVKGMRTTLKHFQILGTSFMRKREMGDRAPKGGILADEMGLGKTLMMLANIVNGKPKDKKVKTTLIVASPALVSQWYQEIRRHCQSAKDNKQHGIGTVIQHRAGYRINSNDILSVLETADIVLTTYSEVNSSYPKVVVPPNLVTAEAKDRWWREFYEENKGPLHSIKWLRVVLDEAQAIKNHRSHTSLACRALKSRFTWAITGTPIQNGIKEFYPYFKLLGVPNTGSYKVFKHNFATPNDPDGSEKLNVFLRQFMIRRTHLDRFAGARLLDLPPPHQTTLWLEFGDVERAIYDIVKKRFVERINSMKRGKLEKSYGSIWSMVVRLRQMCAHILLVVDNCIDLLEREDFELLNKLTADEDESNDEGAALMIHLKNILRSEAHTKVIEAGTGSTTIQENESLATGVTEYYGDEEAIGGKHGRNYRFRKHLDDLKHSELWDAVAERTTCCGCRQRPHDPQITKCFHIFCRSCIRDLQHYAARRGHDQARCSECGTTFTYCEPLEDVPEPKETSSSKESEEPEKASKSKKKDHGMDWISAPGEILPSAKTIAIKSAILNYKAEDEDVKIIIYTQWRPMVKILGKVCETERWGFEKYMGDMSHDSRAQAIHKFSTDPNKNILICGLKCGGLGLNLTVASKVLLVDPWWNAAVENQAFARCYRIGQDKETTLVKLVVKNTIDQAMMNVKERKQIEIDDVMNSQKMKQKLTVEDLMRLFGKVEEDEDGVPFIFADEPEDEHIRLRNVDDEDEMGFMGNDE